MNPICPNCGQEEYVTEYEEETEDGETIYLCEDDQTYFFFPEGNFEQVVILEESDLPR